MAAPAFWKSAYRYDKTSTSTSDQLKQVLNISPTSAEPQTVVAVRGSQIRIAHLTGRSITEVPADPKTARKIEKYLADSGYSTGLSYATFVTLQDAVSLAWDVAGPLRVSMENLTHRADPGLA